MPTTEKLGEWDGKNLKVFGDESRYEDDLVIKRPDSFLGIGDSFLKHGKDFKTASDIRKLLIEKYKDVPAIVLQLVRPDKS